MIRSSVCRLSHADRLGPPGSRGDHGRQLHHVAGHDRTGTIEGRWPVIEATRVNPPKAEVWVANERASTMRGEFTIQDGRWALVFVEFGGIP